MRVEALSGQHVIREALRARRRKLIRLSVLDERGPGAAADLRALGEAAGVPVETATRARLAERAGPEARVQSAVLEAGPLPEVSLEVLAAGEPGARRIVALDGVEDPQNLGAVARVAEAAGVCGLLLTRHRAPPLSPAVTRASAGAIEHLPVARVTNLSRALADLQAKGFWCFGADPQGGEDLFALPDRILRGDVVLVLGAEGKGIRPLVADGLDHRVRIPMAGRVASLNVSTAAAVFLFELLRRSGSPKGPSERD